MRGRILRVRPGHLSNFSGGAGYMPFIVLLSVPLAFVLWLVAAIMLPLRTAGLRRQAAALPETARSPGDSTLDYMPSARVDAHEVARRGAWVLGICGIVATVAALALTVQATNMLYNHAGHYTLAALLFAAGPFVAAGFAAGAQFWLTIQFGARWFHIPLSLTLFGVMLAGTLYWAGSLS